MLEYTADMPCKVIIHIKFSKIKHFSKAFLQNHPLF